MKSETQQSIRQFRSKLSAIRPGNDLPLKVRQLKAENFTGQDLKDCREAWGMNQGEFAEIMADGTHEDTIGRAERGKSPVPEKCLPLLYSFLKERHTERRRKETYRELIGARARAEKMERRINELEKAANGFLNYMGVELNDKPALLFTQLIERQGE